MKTRLTLAERIVREEQRLSAMKDAESAPKQVKTPKMKPEVLDTVVDAVKTMRSPLTPVPILEWHGMYDEGWRGLITPESFTHPAKVGRALIRQIYDYLFDIGALTKEAIVVDPFGGIGTTAIEGSWRGCRVVCCELEPKFVALAKANIELHRHGLETMQLPIPTIIQGDSRQLRAHVRATVDALVSSPPYAEIATGAGGLNTQPGTSDQQTGRRADSASQATDQHYGAADGQLSRLPKGEVDTIIASPPYEETDTKFGAGLTRVDMSKGGPGSHDANRTVSEYGNTTGQLGKMKSDGVDALISSPPYAETLLNDEQRHAADGKALRWGTHEEYGTTEGQLGVLKDASGVDAVVSSPPYETGQMGGGGDSEKIGSRVMDAMKHGYGDTDGQLEQMASDGVDAVISSPPYADQPMNPGETSRPEAKIERLKAEGNFTDAEKVRQHSSGAASNLRQHDYGSTDGQLGAAPEDTFWTAARDIVRESYLLLKPGGYAVWIVKSFVRNKEIVDFPGDWRRLCEYVGFETLTEVHAMLVKETTHAGLFGEDIVEKTEKKSFFRRLAEKKGSPKIDFEVVYFMRKS